MRASKFKRILAFILAVILILGNSGVTSLAATGGMHGDNRGDGIRSSGGGSGGKSNYIVEVLGAGGGWKISFLRMEKGVYRPDENKPDEIPVYDASTGITPISVNGNTLPPGYQSENGRYGIAPIYFLDNIWEYDREFIVNSDLTVSRDYVSNAITGKRISESDVQKAATKVGATDKDIPTAIWQAFGEQTNILGNTIAANEFLKMVPAENADEAQLKRNEDIINTFVQLMLDKYGENSAIGQEILRVKESETETYAILMEPVVALSVLDGDKSKAAYITPAVWAMRTYGLSPKQYTSYPNFNEMMKVAKNNKVDSAFYDGTGTHFHGLESLKKFGGYTGVIGEALGGTDLSSVSSPFEKRESAFSRMIFIGWVRSSDGSIRNAKPEDYKLGFGLIHMEDYAEVTPITPTNSMTTSTSMTILGQKSGLTPNISVGLATTGDVNDDTLNSKVSEAISDLDKFANDNKITADTIEQYFNSDMVIEILEILIKNYNEGLLEETNFSGKKEDILGNIQEFLDKTGLDLDSIYLARYINMLLKNGNFDESGTFTFNTDRNKQLIRYLYTIFVPELSEGYRILTNIEEAYKGKTSLYTGDTGKGIGFGLNTVDTSNLVNRAKLDEITIFGGLTANVTSPKTSVDYKYSVFQDKKGVGGNGIINTDEKEAQDELEKLYDGLMDNCEQILRAYEHIEEVEARRSSLETFTRFWSIKQDNGYTKIVELAKLTYREYVAKSAAYIKPLSEKDFEKVREEVLKELDKLPKTLSKCIGNNNKLDSKVEQTVLKLKELTRKLYGNDSYDYFHDICLEYLRGGIEGGYGLYTDIVKSLNHSNLNNLNIEELVGLYMADNGIENPTWVDNVYALVTVLLSSVDELAKILNKSVTLKYYESSNYENVFNYLDEATSNRGEYSSGEELRVSGNYSLVERVLGKERTDVSVDMNNSISSLMVSSRLTEFSNAALEIPKVEASKRHELIGASISPFAIDTSHKVYYSPIVYTESLLLHNGYYGTLKVNEENGSTMKGDIYALDTEKADLDIFAAGTDLDSTMEDLILSSSLNYPYGSLYTMSDEIQVMLSDYINDCIEYTQWYWSDNNKAKSKSYKDLNEKLNNELQYRVGMYLDIIKDTRDTAKYYNALTSKEAVNKVDKDSIKPDYQWVWDASRKTGYVKISPYYAEVENDNGLNLASLVQNKTEGLKDINKGKVLGFMTGSEDRVYYPNIFGTTFAYLSEKTYKFNRLIDSSFYNNVKLYVGGAFQYPLSFVTCDVDFSEFGAKPVLGTTYLYSVYSINLDPSNNTNYFYRHWPTEVVGGKTLENVGRQNGVYEVADLFIKILEAGKNGGFTQSLSNNKQLAYTLVDANAANPLQKEGSVISVASTVRNILGIPDNDLIIYRNSNNPDKKYSSLENIIDYLKSNNSIFTNGYKTSGNSPKVIDIYMSEELIALTQYLFENLVPDKIKDNKLKIAFKENGEYYTKLVGNGAFELAIKNILSASTSKQNFSWVEGIKYKLKDSNGNLDNVYYAYKAIMHSLLNSIVDGSNIDTEYLNKKPLIHYDTSGLSYGELNDKSIGGLVVDNEVFKYYVENIVALSALTKNLTAVYIADDGEVSQTSFVTALGGAAAKYEYLNNLHLVYNLELEDITKELNAINNELDTLDKDIEQLTNDEQELLKKQEDVSKNFEKESNNDALVKEYTQKYKRYKEIEAKLDQLREEMFSLTEFREEQKAIYLQGVEKSKELPKQKKKYEELVKNTQLMTNGYYTKFISALDEANKKLPPKLKYAAKVTASQFSKLYTSINTAYGLKDATKVKLMNFYTEHGVVSLYENYKASANKLEEYKKTLQQIDKELKVYNSRALDLQKSGIDYLWEEYEKLVDKTNALVEEREKLEKELATLETEIKGNKNTNLEAALNSYKQEYNKVENEKRERVEELTSKKEEKARLEGSVGQLEKAIKNLGDLIKALDSKDVSDGEIFTGVSYQEFLQDNLSTKDINPRAEDGSYIFNLTYWEYEDNDSGAVVYLPGNSNAIFNPAKLGEGKTSLTDNHDNRLSKLVDMKAFGTTIDEIATSMDTIASLALQSSAKLSKGLIMYNFVYKNGSWPVQAIVNGNNSQVVTSNIVFDQDIPIDVQLIEVDNNGTILKYHDLIKNFTSVPSHVMTYIDIAEAFKLGGIEVEVQHVALVPTVENKGIYEIPSGIGKNILTALQNSDPSQVNLLEGLGFNGMASYLQPMKDMRYKYTTATGDTEEITGKYLISLTEYDRDMYAKDRNAHPILVLLVKVKEPIRQINIIETYDGNTIVEEVEPTTNADETEVVLARKVVVPGTSGSGVGDLQEWVVVNTEDLPDSIIGWSDVPSKTVNSGTTSTVKPIEGGQTVIVRYTESGLAGLTGDLILEQNEITKKYALKDYDGKNLGMMSSISAISKSHTHDLGGSKYVQVGTDPMTGQPIYGYKWISDIRTFDYTKAIDDTYEHKYKVTNEGDIDGNVIATVDEVQFKPILKDYTTGVQKVTKSGKSDITVSPDYDFVLWRGYDRPTLASFKNSTAIKDELAKLGITSGITPQDRIINQGAQDNLYQVNIKIGKDDTGDYTTIWGCPHVSSETANQTHTMPSDRDHKADAVVRTYTGSKPNIANAQGQNNSNLKFEIEGKKFNTAMGFVIPNNKTVSFYPYIKMVYEDINQNKKDAYVLSTNLSEMYISDYVDIGYYKSAAVTLNMESTQWSTHAKTQQFLKNNGITDKSSVLPGGATYKLDTGKAEVYVGLRTWQLVIPSDTINYVQSGDSYFSASEVESRRKDLVNQITNNLEGYDIVQYIAEGIITEPAKIAEKGVVLDKIASGVNQKVFGVALSLDDKYYLKTKTPVDSKGATEADLDVISVKDVKQVIYTIKSDVDGNVWVEKGGRTIASINKTQNINELLKNDEIKELDERTKLVTNYLAVIDRNKGDVKGDRWYNEAWDGLSVVMTETLFQVGFKEPAVRAAVLDPKLVGKIDSKSDLYNYKDAKKVRSSIFRTAINNNVNNKSRWIATWGETKVDIILKNIENMFISKPFYIPNATVQDNQW